VTSFGREGLCGLLSALKSRYAFGQLWRKLGDDGVRRAAYRGG
jgi:hypothetical protein